MTEPSSECTMQPIGQATAVEVESENLNLHRHNICAPIKTLSELQQFLRTPPEWIKNIVHLMSRSNSVIKNDVADCHVESHKFVPKVRLDRNFVPKTLVCHDMKNGYLEDKYVGPVNVGNGYTFYHWSQIDIFIYFSHHLITIPPLCWINVSHKNGVPILGTFITEWKEGKKICEDILQDEQTMKNFADALIEICILFKLDGWFVNIENVIEHPVKLRQFLRYLTARLHERKSGTLVIWYDSVTVDGELKWQNELNDLNRCYFDVCDGIFLNYGWNKNNLEKSVEAAEHRVLDVYVGVDIFGRGCFGGGKFNAHLAAEAIRNSGLSMAIFGQGWTHETLEAEPQETFLERFYERDNKLWKSLWPYLFTHPLKYIFETFFHTGVDREWYTLEKQDVQPSRVLLLCEENNTDRSDEVSALKDTCSCLQLYVHDDISFCRVTNERLDDTKTFVHHLFSCKIQINGDFTVFVYTKDVDVDHVYDYSIILLVQDKFGRIKKIICHSNEQHIHGKSPTVIQANPSKNYDLVNYNGPNDVLDSCRFRCFNLYGDHIKILEIGVAVLNGKSVCICGFGFKVNA